MPGHGTAITHGMRHAHIQQLVKFAAAAVVAMTVAVAEAAAQSKGLRNVRIVASLTDHKLVVLDGDRVVKVYETAVGKPSTPSPVGEFTVINMVSNPVYKAHGQDVAAGAKNPVGTRWIGLSKRGYGIHGTNAPKSIGRDASHGCIRLRNKDVEELYALVSVGVPVELRNGPIFELKTTELQNNKTSVTD
jgi:lipoprotein-anchoring transpeptidase ErfK/SrfK